MKITPKVTKMMRSRAGNGAPPWIVSGSASAITSESAPRSPAHATKNGFFQRDFALAAWGRRWTAGVWMERNTQMNRTTMHASVVASTSASS